MLYSQLMHDYHDSIQGAVISILSYGRSGSFSLYIMFGVLGPTFLLFILKMIYLVLYVFC
jgi:hypothetical protein